MTLCLFAIRGRVGVRVRVGVRGRGRVGRNTNPNPIYDSLLGELDDARHEGVLW